MNSGPGRAVQPDRQQVGVAERRDERVSPLTAEHRAIGSIVPETMTGARRPSASAALRMAISAALVLRVPAGLDRSRSTPPFEQGSRLGVEVLDQIGERDPTRDGDRLVVGRSDPQRTAAWPAWQTRPAASRASRGRGE